MLMMGVAGEGAKADHVETVGLFQGRRRER